MPSSGIADEIRVVSDKVEIQESDECLFAKFSQNAKIVCDTFSLQGDVIEVLSNKQDKSASTKPTMSSIKHIYAIGTASFEHALYHGKGDKISIDPSKQILTIEGNAQIFDNEHGTVKGERVILDSANKQIRVEGGPSQRSTVSVNDILQFKAKINAEKKIE